MDSRTQRHVARVLEIRDSFEAFKKTSSRNLGLLNRMIEKLQNKNKELAANSRDRLIREIQIYSVELSNEILVEQKLPEVIQRSKEYVQRAFQEQSDRVVVYRASEPSRIYYKLINEIGLDRDIILTRFAIVYSEEKLIEKIGSVIGTLEQKLSVSFIIPEVKKSKRYNKVSGTDLENLITELNEFEDLSIENYANKFIAHVLYVNQVTKVKNFFESDSDMVFAQSETLNCLLEASRDISECKDNVDLFTLEQDKAIRKEFKHNEIRTNGYYKNSIRPWFMGQKLNGKSSFVTKSNLNLQYYHKSSIDLKNAGFIKGKLVPFSQSAKSHKNRKAKNCKLVHNNCHVYQKQTEEAKYRRQFKEKYGKEIETKFEYLEQIPWTGIFVDYKVDSCGRIVYAKRLIENKENSYYLVQKIYNPNWVHGSTEPSTKYEHTLNARAQMYTKFIKRHKMIPSQNSLHNFLTKKSIRYIGQKTYKNENATKCIDLKRAYSSYHYSEFFKGIPYGPMTLSNRKFKDTQVSFYVIKEGYYEIPEFDVYDLDYTDITVLPYPIYEYLESIGTKLPCQAYIYQKMLIPDKDFFNEYDKNIKKLPKEIEMPSGKLIANNMVGMLIANSKTETRTLRYRYDSETEKQIIIETFELIDKEITRTKIVEKNKTLIEEPITMKPEILILDGIIEILLPKMSNTAFYDAHSTIISFSQVSMMQEIKKIGIENIHFVKTDCIGFSGRDDLEYPNKNDTGPLKFGLEPKFIQHIDKRMRSFKSYCSSTCNIPESMFYKNKIIEYLYDLREKGLASFEYLDSLDRLYFAGPGGIGKTWNCINMKKQFNLKMSLSAPTNNLLKSNESFSKTTHKEFNLLSTKKVSKDNETDIFVIDEIFMRTQKELQSILSNNVPMLIVCGDICQCKSLGTQITEEFLCDQGFSKIILNRPEDPKLANLLRHDQFTGRFFDFMRQYVSKENCGSFIDKFKDQFKNSKKFKDIYDSLTSDRDMKQLDQTSRVLVSDNLQAYKVNKKMKKYYKKNGIKLFPCKFAKKNKNGVKGQRTFVDIDSELIWWSRKKMTDKIPKGYIYEPAYCTTIFSSQGTEYKKFENGSLQKVYIFESNNDFNMYTAVTRVQSLYQIRLCS